MINGNNNSVIQSPLAQISNCVIGGNSNFIHASHFSGSPYYIKFNTILGGYRNELSVNGSYNQIINGRKNVIGTIGNINTTFNTIINGFDNTIRNSNTINAGFSSIFGVNNLMAYGYNNNIIASNSIIKNSSYSTVLGRNNKIYGANYCFITGHDNTVNSPNSYNNVIFGHNNVIEDNCHNNIIIGNNNHIYSGTNNTRIIGERVKISNNLSNVSVCGDGILYNGRQFIAHETYSIYFTSLARALHLDIPLVPNMYTTTFGGTKGLIENCYVQINPPDDGGGIPTIDIKSKNIPNIPNNSREIIQSNPSTNTKIFQEKNTDNADETIPDYIEISQNYIDNILKLNAISFCDKLYPTVRHYGFPLSNVCDLFPTLVMYDNKKPVAYKKLCIYTIAVAKLQQLQKEMDKLQDRFNYLRELQNKIKNKNQNKK